MKLEHKNVYKISTCWHCSKDAGYYCFLITICILYFYHKGINVQYLYWNSSSYIDFPTSISVHLFPTMSKNLFWTAQILQREPVSSPNFNSCLYFLGTWVFYFIYLFIYLIYGNSWIFFITLISFCLEVIDILGLKLHGWQKNYFVSCCNNIKSN